MAERERQAPIRRAIGQGPPESLGLYRRLLSIAARFFCLDLTDASLDLTDKRAVIPLSHPLILRLQ
jgi:hypothetical protein